jgi:hypothetical protein
MERFRVVAPVLGRYRSEVAEMLGRLEKSHPIRTRCEKSQTVEGVTVGFEQRKRHQSAPEAVRG